ncbi:DUF58 domain-containing protein [Chitinophaga lutea]
MPDQRTYPAGVAVTPEELMHYEYYVQQRPILPQHPVYSLLAGRHASRLRGRGLDFEEVRVYVPGDDVRNIDWRVTARTGITHSKVFNEEKERPAFLVVDQTAAMFFGSVLNVKSVTAAHLTALAAFYILKRGDRVGGLIFNDKEHRYIPPRRSKSHVQFLLENVAALNNELPEKKEMPPNTPALNDALQRTRSLVTHDFVVTVIGDLSMTDDQTKLHLRHLALHNDVLLAHVTDPMESDLPDGRLVLSDGRRQIRWNNARHGLGERYAQERKDALQALGEEFRRYRIPLTVFSSASTVEEQVQQYIGKQIS